jgi:hypothetical protein
LQVDFRVEISWIDRQGTEICEPQAIPIPGTLTPIDQTSMLIPEIGQSMATAQAKAIQETAEQIVSLMEAPW